MSEAIRFDGVSYDPGGGFAIRGLDLVVPEGSIYGFLGPNGAGKTTTIRLLMGLLDPAGGRITVLGHPYPSGTVAALGGIGYVPERPHLHPFLTVGESLALHRAFHPGFDQSWADRLLDQFGVPRGRRLSRLSKGEMGKLLVLQALCQRPRLLVLDEPTDGLDPVVRRDVLSAVVDYVSDSGATVFISSHLVHELERLCDWVGVMDGGTLITQLPMAQLKHGIKRLRLAGPVDRLADPPFAILSRNGKGPDAAVWVVDKWEGAMAGWIDERGVRLDQVEDLDLEDGFVERLRARRGGMVA